MSQNGAVVTATGVTKVFKDFWGRPKVRAVDDMALEIREGEVFGLLGPNGSGKSTTVKMILGLLYPTKGRLTVLGDSPRAVKTKARIGYLPEESYLYKYLDSDETLDFFGRLFDLEGEPRRDRSAQLLQMVGLGQARRRRVGELSKGMSRRIGLAQALINDPDLVILDEPTSGLDPLGCREVKTLIENLRRRGKTVVLSSHLLSDVEDVCDRVAILYNGHIHAQGPIKELLAQPDVFRITAPVTTRDKVSKVLDQMRAEAGDGAVQIDTPTRSLESLFLEVIEKAREEQPDSSGAAAGGPVAEYLAASESEARPESVLERLAQPTTEESETEETAVAAEQQTPQPEEPQPDGERLDALVAEAPTDEPSEEDDQPPEPQPQPEQAADKAVLDALVSGRSADDEASPDKERE